MKVPPRNRSFSLKVEFHKSHHEDNQNGQPVTSAKVDQQEGETQPK